eukprot:3972647-Pyramimonas_sp.AAC.1
MHPTRAHRTFTGSSGQAFGEGPARRPDGALVRGLPGRLPPGPPRGHPRGSRRAPRAAEGCRGPPRAS